jgi:hypothetical protein
VQALIRKAKRGNERCVPALQNHLDGHPEIERGFDLAAGLRGLLAGKLCKHDLYMRELLTRQVEDLLDDVVGADPSPIERLLGERVAVGWLQMQQADLAIVDNPSDFDVRLADAAHRRYFAALKALAAYRKLPRPTMQVNIGEQQLNVSG